MFKNYFVVTVRNLKKNSTYSLLNILGLAVGMTAFILIALYVQYELSFDKHFDNANRIYRVVREGRAFTPAPLGAALNEDIPEVELAARFMRRDDTLVSLDQNNFLEDEFYWADPKTFEIFSIPFLSGDPKTALNDPFSIVLSQRTANKYFGRANPMGKTLTVSENFEFTVSGVFSDIPDNSHLIMDVVVPYETFFQTTNNDITSWSSNFSYTYFLLREGASPQVMENKISSLIVIPLFKAEGMKEPYPKMYFVQPITEIHLLSHRM